MQTSPRFIVTAAGARYGARDEFVGYRPARTIFTAETRGWLDRQLAQLPDYWFEDGIVDVIDTQPERDLANWGPALPPYGLRAPGAQDDNDLPF
jgi:hypothetical protein